MGKTIYDFREGLEQDKIVYKNDRCDCKSCVYYTGYLLFTWGLAVGWFAIFQVAYIFHEPIAFWVYIGFWLAFIVSFLIVATVNLCRHYSARAKRRIIKRAIEKKKKDDEEEERNTRAKARADKRAGHGNNDNDIIQTEIKGTEKDGLVN